MKISAIICEYNPMHSGHLHHIAETRRITGCDKLICIMSGSFTQRGEIAVYDKFSRTRAALSAGVDMVIELPTLFCTASAEKFAYGGVYIAHMSGIIDYLSFGCENADMQTLGVLAKILIDEPAQYRLNLKSFLDTGMSFPSARANALSLISPQYSDIINSPNNILAVEYLKAVYRLNSSINAVAIPRKCSGYLDTELKELPSAMAVRSAIKRGISPFDLLPQDIASCYNSPAVFTDSLFIPVMLKLCSLSEEELSKIEGMEEGLAYRLKSASKTAKNYSELICTIKSKRYTQTRINRLLTNLLLDVNKGSAQAPEYIRILGVRKESRLLLSMLSKHSKLPIVVSPASFNHPELKRDILATDIRALLENPPGDFSCDYTSPLIVV